MRAAVFLLLLPLAMVSNTCPSGGSRRDALLGTWSGSWTGDTSSGTLEIDFTSKEPFGNISMYSVEIVVNGGTCPAVGDVGRGSQTAVRLHRDVNFAVQFTGASGSSRGVFRFDGNLVASNELTGVYRMTSESCPQCQCDLGASGVWSADR